MKIKLQVSMNEKLYLRNPDDSDLGRNIISHGISMIKELGIEDFNFRKLAKSIGTTEAGIYRYFENKHRLLIYLMSWYWSSLEYQIEFQTNNLKVPKLKLKKIIEILVLQSDNTMNTDYINEKDLHEIIITEGVKTYHGHKVSQDNDNQFFKPYKDLCAAISLIIKEANPKYIYPTSLASSIIEIAQSQMYFTHHLPRLTDFNEDKDESEILSFIEHMTFKSLDI